ncbi:UBX domain-containing protein 1 [Tanacetum coccineum]
MVVRDVDSKLLEELESMGFSKERSIRALHFSNEWLSYALPIGCGAFTISTTCTMLIERRRGDDVVMGVAAEPHRGGGGWFGDGGSWGWQPWRQ